MNESHTQVLQDAIHSLVEDYPGKFELLAGSEFEYSEEVPVIAYLREHRKVVYSNDVITDTDYIRGCLAFIGILINNSDVYCNVPDGYDCHVWNLAIHTKVIQELEHIGDFNLPDDSVDKHYPMDKRLSIDDLYNRFLVISEGNGTL